MPSDNVDRVETAANIVVRIAVGSSGEGSSESGSLSSIEIPVSEIDRTKEVDVERIRESGLYPGGYAINAIDIDGSITFSGNKVRLPDGRTRDLDDVLFKDDGTPKTFDVTIHHEAITGDQDAENDIIENCILTSSQYNASSGEPTESTYEFIGQRLN